ncbi:MAG: protein kinase [Anaerolineae bacterium]|nr:protein kinase [Anaerolineae bacterium]
MKDFTGQRLGDYQLGGKLGAGTTGAVYPSYQPQTRRAVAVKVIAEELGQTRGFVERFGKDYERIANLNHPHVMAILDFGSIGPNCFYVMRLATDGTLEGKQPSAETSLNYLTQIASALDFIHQQGLVHGGLKPSNVVLEGETVALVDLALANIITGCGLQLAPSPNLAPEQWKHEKSTPRTDVYGLGVLAFQLLTGKPLFEGSSNVLMRKHLNDAPPLATSLQPMLPAGVNVVLQRALEKEPEARYASAGQFVEALMSAMQEKSSAASRSDVPDWLTSPATSTWEEGSWEGWEKGADAQRHEESASPEHDSYSQDESSDWDESAPWGQPADQDLNYYEWERQQQEMEAAQAKALEPDIPMPDLPDLFDDAPSAKPSTGSLAGGDYMPEWFMGVEELSDEDVPDFLKGASLDDSLLNPLGQAAPPPLSPAIEMPDFDALDFPEDEPQIKRLEVQDAGTEAVSLDDLLIEDDEDLEAKPAIRSLETSGVSDAVSLDDLFDEEEEAAFPQQDLRSTSELTSVDGEEDWLASSPDQLALGISAMLGDELPSTGQLDQPDLDWLPSEGELVSAADESEWPEQEEIALDFRAEDEFAPAESELDWLPSEGELVSAADESEWPEQEEIALDFRAEDEFAPAESELDWLPSEETPPPGDVSSELDSLFGVTADLPTTAEFGESEELWDQDEVSGQEAADEPDWLKGYDEPQQPIEQEDASTIFGLEEPKAPDETPEWFGDIDFSNVPDEPALPSEVVEEFAESGDMSDDFLEFDAMNVDDLFGGDTSLTTEEDLSLSNLLEEDDFLKDFPTAPPSEEEVEPASELPFDLPTEEEEIFLVQTEALPEWMKQAAKSTPAEEIILKVGGAEVRLDQIPYLLLPDELRQLRDEMIAQLKQGNGADELPKSGPLAGVEGTLPVDKMISTPGEITLGRMAQLTETQKMRMESLKRVLQGMQQEVVSQKAGIRYDLEKDDIEEPVVAKAPKRRIRPKRDRLVITLLLLLLVLAPFATEALHLAEDPPTELDENAAPLAAAIDELNRAREPLPVLVAFEYGPTAAGELDPLANAVLRDIVANGGRPIVISTNPIGLLHAEQIFRELAADETFQKAIGRDLEAREDYLILRLLTGGPVGVRQLARSESFAATLFAQDINGEDTELEIERPDASSFAFLVVIGERDEDVRHWAEQFNGLELPKFALVTSAAEPMTRPYVSAGNYDGLVAGIGGTLMYDAARNADKKAPFDTDTSLPDPGLSRWHSAALGAFLAAAIISAGAFFNLIRTIRRRRRS